MAHKSDRGSELVPIARSLADLPDSVGLEVQQSIFFCVFFRVYIVRSVYRESYTTILEYIFLNKNQPTVLYLYCIFSIITLCTCCHHDTWYLRLLYVDDHGTCGNVVVVRIKLCTIFRSKPRPVCVGGRRRVVQVPFLVFLFLFFQLQICSRFVRFFYAYNRFVFLFRRFLFIKL